MKHYKGLRNSQKVRRSEDECSERGIRCIRGILVSKEVMGVGGVGGGKERSWSMSGRACVSETVFKVQFSRKMLVLHADQLQMQKTQAEMNRCCNIGYV